MVVNFGDQYSNSVSATRVCFWLKADPPEDTALRLLLPIVDIGGHFSKEA